MSSKRHAEEFKIGAVKQAPERRCPERLLCQMTAAHPSGYYAWRAKSDSPWVKNERHLLGLIEQFRLKSGGIYGYRKMSNDLRDEGETCGKHRVYRLMRAENLHSQTTILATKATTASYQSLRPIVWRSSSMSTCPTTPGRATSPISGRLRVGSILLF